MVRKEDVVYIVDEKNRKVVAYVEGTKFELIEFISENKGILPEDPFFDSANRKLYEALYLPNKFIGIATCGPNDEWNPEIGKLIAYHRMKTNLSKSFFKHAETYYREMLKKIEDTVDKINDYGKKLSVNYERRVNMINEIVGDAEEK